MYRKKKRRIIGIFIFVSILVISMIVMLNAKNRNESNMSFSDVTKEAVEDVNENYYDISFDKKTKTAEVDGNTVAITELLNIDDRQLNELISTNNFESFVSQNLIGNIEYDGDSIIVENPYSTNTLIVETEDKNIFSNYKNIKSFEEVADNLYLVDYENAQDTKDGYSDLKKDIYVSNVFTDHKVSISDIGSDIDSNSDFNIQSVSSDNLAWGVIKTGMDHYSKKLIYENNTNEVIVAVLDTGVNTNHEAFTSKTSKDRISFNYSYDYVNDDSDASDDNGHGTQVAGVVAESTPDSIKIIPVKVMGSNGKGSMTDVMRAVSAIYEYVDIINLSLGVSESELGFSELLIMDRVFQRAYNAGTIVVCAAGNEGTAVDYPASSSYTLAASAIQANGTIASFSNYGNKIDFALPGVYLKLPNYTGVTDYTTISGTSFSSPFLAAAVALVKADYSYNSIEDIVDVLIANSIDLGEAGKDNYFGYGCISFDDFMFEKPLIVSSKVLETTWAGDNTISICALAAKKMQKYAITTTEDEPTSWTNLTQQTTDLELELKVTENGTYYVWLQDEDGNIVHTSVEAEYVDSIDPVLTSFTSSKITDSSFTLDLVAKDDESGIKKIKWFYKKTSDEEYNNEEEVYQTPSIGTINKTFSCINLDNYTEYKAYAEIYDCANHCITTDVITITTSKIEVRLEENEVIKQRVKNDVDLDEYINDKQTEYENSITAINNSIWGLDIEDLSSLFVNDSENTSYIEIVGELSEVQTEMNEDNKLIRYYTLEYNTVNVEQAEYTITVENKTNSKATVRIDNEESTSDFSITTAAQGLTVKCDEACIVLMSIDNGDNYTRITGDSIEENKYSFLADFDSDIKFVIALKGDVNLNGNVNVADIMLINRSLQIVTSTIYRALSNIEILVADIDNNDLVDIQDALSINHSIISTTASLYHKIDW